MEIDTYKIKALLAEKLMSQADLAKASGISRQNVSVILAKEKCSTITAGKISRGLGVHVNEILKRE